MYQDHLNPKWIRAYSVLKCDEKNLTLSIRNRLFAASIDMVKKNFESSSRIADPVGVSSDVCTETINVDVDRLDEIVNKFFGKRQKPQILAKPDTTMRALDELFWISYDTYASVGLATTGDFFEKLIATGDPNITIEDLVVAKTN